MPGQRSGAGDILGAQLATSVVWVSARALTPAPIRYTSVRPGGIVAAGDILTWRSTTNWRLSKKTVYVQLQTHQGWVSVNSGTVAKNGQIAVRFRVNERGLKTYRRYIPRNSLYAGAALAHKIAVYQWFPLRSRMGMEEWVSGIPRISTECGTRIHR